MADVLDTDDPVLRGVLARLCVNLAGQLTKVGADVERRASISPWQSLPLAARLERVRVELDFLARDVSRLVTIAEPQGWPN